MMYNKNSKLCTRSETDIIPAFEADVPGSIPGGCTKCGALCASRRHVGAEAGSRKNSVEFYV